METATTNPAGTGGAPPQRAQHPTANTPRHRSRNVYGSGPFAEVARDG